MEKKTKRTAFEIERDINEYRQRMAEATRNGDFVRINLFANRIAEVMKEKDDLLADKKFFRQERNLDRNLISMAAKTLALMLNTADMSIYYHEIYMAYFKERGFEPVPEWSRKAREFEKAATEFRRFIAYFFQGRNIDNYFQQMDYLMDCIEEKVFTDREKKYLDEYRRK